VYVPVVKKVAEPIAEVAPAEETPAEVAPEVANATDAGETVSAAEETPAAE
jgi:hypothetical protein